MESEFSARKEGHKAYLENQDRRVYLAASTVGREVIETLYSEDEMTAEEITETLEGEGISANSRFINRFLGLLEAEDYIDLEQEGTLHAATKRVYASNGIDQEEVIEFAEGYIENARAYQN